MAPGRYILVVALGAAVGMLGVAAVGREALFAESYADPAKAARQLWLDRGGTTGACREPDLGRDPAALLDALEIVESFANTSVARGMERLVYQAYRTLGRRPPDLTYGQLQIRYSKFEIYRVADSDDIFDECAARRAARRLLEAEASMAADGELDRQAVLRVAGRFNGQIRAGNSVAARMLANAVYNEIVYHVFQEARFARRSRMHAGVDR